MATQRIDEETRALWVEVFGETPCAVGDPRSMLQHIIEKLPPVGYDRLNTRALDHAGVVCPPTRAQRLS